MLTRMRPSYLVLPNARSRYAGHYIILSDTPPPPPEIPNPKPNGAILTVCKTIRNVMTSAAKAETAGGVFGNRQEIIAIRILLKALGHPQLATPLKTNNSTSNSFVHANIKQRHSKTWDMRWNWPRDRATQPPATTYVPLVGQRNRQQCRLLYETPSSVASPSYASTICFKRTPGNYTHPPFRCEGVFRN
jgi:hypothetical protein